MSTEQLPSFGTLLRQYRRAARLTQEELAERARLSPAAINTLERGTRRTPRRETIALLTEALALTASERALLEAAARQHWLPPPAPSAAPPGAAIAPPQTGTAAPPMLAPHPLAQVGLPSAEAGSDSGAEAAHSPTIQASSLVPAEGGRPRRAPLPSFAQLAWALLYPPLRARGGQGVGAGKTLLAGVLLVTVIGGGVLWAGGSGLVALFGHHVQPRGGKLCLASNFPTTGDFAGEGKLLQNAVQLAVVQSLNLGAGYTLDFVGYNDASAALPEDPEQGATNVADMVHDACVMGMVGPFISPVAPPEMTIAVAAGLAMISPSNTEPGLTLRQSAESTGYSFDQLHPPGKKINYFRIPPTMRSIAKRTRTSSSARPPQASTRRAPMS